ncbi:luciferase-like domain-containing protein [Pseudoneurospora amorphoporcata]|uniref:Luciferase-like domain-containing protein n=1 Tax=Pseudoneurospora amorphoporcata TaxID=241081 RepID=A0AAN6SEK0_9PEZI|nr:luciferase-like domain-containing protein [Pseudoneurospora amorphoporcata]
MAPHHQFDTVKRKWYHIKWFADSDTPRERRLIMKLDLLIVPYAFLAYWIKYIDQANLNNAYVAGLKEDLNFHGNELVQLQTLYTVGAVVGQIPFMFLFTYLPMHWTIPFLDIAWGFFTLAQYRATSFGQMAAYRFLIGWFEAAFYPAMHYIFGSWYRGDEISRRGGVFYTGLTLGTLTAGLIQSAASSRLEGVDGLAGWRWMYIICALITIPVGILGYFILPGTPEHPNKWFLQEEDVRIAKERLARVGHSVAAPKFNLSTLKSLANNGKFWALLVLDVFFWNGSINYSAGGYLLWLKSLGKYSQSEVNQLGTISPAIGIFYVLFICFVSDLVVGPAWAITIAHIWNIIGLVILVIWNVPDSALWFAFMTTYSSVAMSAVLYGWVNAVMGKSSAERSFAIVLLNTVAQSTTAWTQLLTFPTTEAPQFRKGYSFVLANAVCLIITAQCLNVALKRSSPPPVQPPNMADTSTPSSTANAPKKQIVLNAFDMFTPGHLSPGQWKNPLDRSSTKFDSLDYWINLAKLLEKGGINALFLADTYGGYDTYEGSLDECVRRGAQWPVGDPIIPISAMAAVTKNLAFGITASTSFEPPFLLAKRFSTLDHLTKGRIGWNIVTSWKKSAFKAIGLDNPIEHDQRYEQADEYLRVLYKLWNASWTPSAISPNPSLDIYTDPSQVRQINHSGKYLSLSTPHIVPPSPQRTPFLFQAGTSSAGSDFATTHAEAVFVSSHSPSVLAPKVAELRRLAKSKGRDAASLKVFATFTPIVGRTEEEAQQKYEEARKNASVIGGLVLFSGWTGIDISQFSDNLDQEISASDSKEKHKVLSIMESFTTPSEEVPRWTARVVAERAAMGGLGPVSVGTAAQVADEMERWVKEADVDGFNVAYVTTPGTFVEVVDLLVPELRRRGLYPEQEAEGAEAWTAREKVYGRGQKELRTDHVGRGYDWDVLFCRLLQLLALFS